MIRIIYVQLLFYYIGMEPGREERSTSSSSNKIDSYINQIMNSFRIKAGIRPETKIRIIDETYASDDSVKVSISYNGEHPIKSSKLNEDVLVTAPVNAELYLDKKSNLLKYQIQEPDPIMIETLREELDYKLRTGQIQFIGPDTNASMSELFAKKKPFYIERDHQGKLHLKRAYFQTY